MLLYMVAMCAGMIFETDDTVGFNSIKIGKKINTYQVEKNFSKIKKIDSNQIGLSKLNYFNSYQNFLTKFFFHIKRNVLSFPIA